MHGREDERTKGRKKRWKVGTKEKRSEEIEEGKWEEETGEEGKGANGRVGGRRRAYLFFKKRLCRRSLKGRIGEKVRR